MVDTRATQTIVLPARPEAVVRVRTVWEQAAELLLTLATLEADVTHPSTKVAVHEARNHMRHVFTALAKADKLENA